MKRSHLWILAVLLFVACGGDDGAGPAGDNNGTPLPDPVPTAVGTPDGAPTTQTIGAAGGSITSSDGAFTLNVPAGAIASDTDITVQPITNTAWGGIGKGYLLTPDGLTFSQPVGLEFQLAPEDLAGSAPEALDAAFQDAAGFWFIVKDGSYDTGSGTLSCTTTHFSSYTAIEEYKMTPVSAGVGPLSSVTLHIEQCFYETIAQDPTAIMQVLTCSDYDPDLVTLVNVSDWSVNGIRGGNTSVGRIVELDGNSAKYTAPASTPLANPVAVSVKVAVRRGSATYLVSNINITNEFTGTVTHVTGSGNVGEKAVYTMTWTSDGALGDVESFTGQGTIDYTPGTQPDCTEDFTPTHAPTTNAYMIVNHAGNPLQVTVAIGADWDVHECTQCLTDPPICQDFHFFASFEDGQTGTVSTDGNTITGYFLDLNNGENWYYTFTRTAPAP